MAKGECSVLSGLELVEADREAYESLKRFHYRQGSLGPYSHIFGFAEKDSRRRRFVDFAGVIVYGMPVGSGRLRNIATGGMFSGCGSKGVELCLLNRNVRCISRVIIEPRYRGLGLGAELVRRTLGLVGVPIVEAMAVMGRINPFFERAGMVRFDGELPGRCLRLAEAFSAVGIEGDVMVDSAAVYKMIGELGVSERRFVESEICRFMEAYGLSKERYAGVERIRFVLSRLWHRPVYYFWRNGEEQASGIRD